MSKKLRVSSSSFTGSIILLVIRNNLSILLFISIFTLLISRSSPKFSNNISSFLTTASAPIFAVLNSPIYTLKNSKNAISSYFFVYKKNKILLTEKELLKNKVLKLSVLQTENMILKSLLNFKDINSFNSISSRVYVSTKNQSNNYAIIDKGTNDNVAKGQAVVTKDNLVGRILKTSKNNSHLILINDFNSRIPIYSSKSREKAILIGRENALPELHYLNKEHKLEADEIIYTSGDGVLYPANIPIGISVKKEGKVYVSPFVDVENVDIVQILTK